MSHFGICKLCDKNKLIKLSHIITKNLYDGVYDELHRFKPIIADNKNNSKQMQDGYKEYLLCGDCEQKFGNWEKYLKSVLLVIEKEKSGNNLELFKLSNGNILINGLNYKIIKNALLSIVWRMSISSIKEFKDFNLGNIEIDFKNILKNDLTPEECEYPIFMTKTIIPNNELSGINTIPDKIIQFGHYKLVEFTIYGFLFNIILSKEKLLENRMKLILRENGELQARVKDIKDIGIEDKILNRLYDNDIRTFYQF